MKNIIKKFLIVFISLLIILTSNLVVNAEETTNEGQSDLEATDTSDDSTDLTDNMDSTDSIDDLDDEDEDSATEKTRLNKNFYSFNDKDVTITNDILGDVYIVTSGKVSINSYISGNVFILASNVEITKDSEISSLYCISDTLDINSDIVGTVYSITNKFNLSKDGYIYRDLYLIAQSIDISGYIDRNANISSTEIVVSDYACISGDFNYFSPKEIDKLEDVVDGKINYTQKNSSDENKNGDIIINILLSIISYMIFVIIIFLILKWLKSKLIENNNNNNLLKYIIYGFLGLILVPIVSTFLLILGITANVAILLFIIYVLILIVSSSITIINFTNTISQKNDIKQDSILENILSISVTCIIYKFLQLIPYVGTILTLIFTISGFGIILKTLVETKNTNVNNI